MRGGHSIWLKLAVLTPMMALFGNGSGCLADGLRELAQEADDLATQLDGEEELQDQDFGDLLDHWF